ncbi:hypothetical protein GCM10010193_14390 [Kitasatospora atroaurantiaca]|uniref:hypothetical protein n=1 Tax=Kitasatospora atroaurantiaca TaxID=285545 RepID=UPI0011A87494|nr:hypothetical protein [Kitasatospora atroaurantiaca]
MRTRPLPAALPPDRLTGLLNRLPDPRTRLSAALAAVHALGSHTQRHLLTEHLDPTRGRLTIRRPGRLDHTVYLDEARHSADPLDLVRLFDISPGTAMRYINTAHPAGPPP